jgi:uncharacterized protein YkwD
VVSANGTSKLKAFAVLAIGALFVTTPETADFAASADDSGLALYGSVDRLREGCAPLVEDPRLAEAALRHADDMLKNGVNGHIGSDGSSPLARITEAGFRTRYSGEVIFWGTAATPTRALDFWMQSPPHQAIIVNCGYTAAGFATTRDGNKMTVVGDFAAP